ncbi:hypothetical protein [Falsirhodobacter xinxiangensis]|uniref:hypothetical protein n=1 Tax=Falsirhodobacter xinxiangensis TaxID=2530049 RepID=UPI0010AA6DD2|nr:hypothetical protein [Rhodobacter xinxiangensis]
MIRWGIMVKTWAKLGGEHARTAPLIAYQARARGFVTDVKQFHEYDIDPIELHNAWLLHGVRRADPEADMRAEDVVDAMSGIVSLSELSDRVGLGPRGTRAVVRLIRTFHLKLVQHEKIEPHSLVFKAKSVRRGSITIY